MTLKEVEKALSNEQSMHEFKKRHGLLEKEERSNVENLEPEKIDRVEDIPLWQQELMRTR